MLHKCLKERLVNRREELEGAAHAGRIQLLGARKLEQRLVARPKEGRLGQLAQKELEAAGHRVDLNVVIEHNRLDSCFKDARQLLDRRLDTSDTVETKLVDTALLHKVDARLHDKGQLR